MDIGVVGGGVNGLCCAWQLAKQGQQVRLYERDTLVKATSCTSSKLLHGGLRYLENREFRLVREALRERDSWIRRAPHLAKPLRLVIPVYQQSRRPRWKMALGLLLYDHLVGKNLLPKTKRLSAHVLISRDPLLKSEGLQSCYEFSDGQMNDRASGLWGAEQARQRGVTIFEHTEVSVLTKDGQLTTADGTKHQHDRLVNVAGPWANRLLRESGIDLPHELDLVRGSHLVLEQPCKQAYLLESPNDHRIFFVLPWHGKTLGGTTEVRQALNEPIVCSTVEQSYLLNAWTHNFLNAQPKVIDTFAGLRPLLLTSQDPTTATREHAIHRTEKLLSVFGGKWTTALALADKVKAAIH